MNMKMRCSVAVAAGMLMAIITFASDTNIIASDKEMLAGAGAIACDVLLLASSKDAAPVETAFFVWAQGFWSGLNFAYIGRDAEATDLDDREGQRLLLEGYCTENPSYPYMMATTTVWNTLRLAQGLEPDPRFEQ